VCCSCRAACSLGLMCVCIDQLCAVSSRVTKSCPRMLRHNSVPLVDDDKRPSRLGDCWDVQWQLPSWRRPRTSPNRSGAWEGHMCGVLFQVRNGAWHHVCGPPTHATHAACMHWAGMARAREAQVLCNERACARWLSVVCVRETVKDGRTEGGACTHNKSYPGRSTE